MSRVNIDLPSTFLFTTELTVRITDINYNGHLGNDAVLSLVHEARMRFLRHFGFTELDIAGVGIIMADSAVIYRSEAFQGDILVIDIAVDDIRPTGCDLLYRLAQKSSGREVARVKTGIVFFDYSHRKIVPMPEQFRFWTGGLPSPGGTSP
jgi:acyl-CoA thioester hydrolase